MSELQIGIFIGSFLVPAFKLALVGIDRHKIHKNAFKKGFSEGLRMSGLAHNQFRENKEFNSFSTQVYLWAHVNYPDLKGGE